MKNSDRNPKKGKKHLEWQSTFENIILHGQGILSRVTSASKVDFKCFK